jgi:hypothetical protein
MPYSPVRSTSRLTPADRQTARALATIERRAILHAGRVQAASFVGKVSLLEIKGLTDMEAQLISMNPLGEPRYKEIVDTVTSVAAGEIMALAL